MTEMPLEVVPEATTAVPAFPGRLAFGRPSHATGLPGAPVEPPALAPPDVVLDGFSSPEGAARCASVRGDDHRYYGEPRQDAAACFALSGAVSVLVVADGVGSQPLSYLGSGAAVRGVASVPPEMWELFPAGQGDEAALELVRVANNAVTLASEAHGIDPRSAATTLVCVVVWTEPNGSRSYCAVRVGDSEAHLVRGGHWIPLLSALGNDDIVSNRTHSLPAREPVVEACSGALQPGDILLACTDGFASTLRAEGRREHLTQSWQEPPSLTELLWHVDASVRSYGDDRSVAVWWEAT